ncbi:hypothetical protein H310_04545 [Aphanomyces invadans]|uniref:Uncharacterized protein n=1 Tax=Aphanomyces invadans TaxID=157072 RepID=A0A024UCQ1_9STRA|nr:hypothetical protein H310_04545 [Aphanomyces invadans]ETW04201.1 hypothetical protein H310_04545 [Aphanomyces invadans]|eukprot:XP_008867157.1 hypothetical protein H310_04545 [Aphanomyces invadans]
MLQRVKARGSAAMLRPSLQALKDKAELSLSKKTGDVVLFSKNMNSNTGMTDLSFETHKSKKRVSMYFTSKPDGIASYRRCAAMLANIDTVELQYTPQFGQSRISFEWDSFWIMMEQNELGFLASESTQPLLQLSGGSPSQDYIDVDGSVDGGATFDMEFEEVKKLE